MGTDMGKLLHSRSAVGAAVLCLIVIVVIQYSSYGGVTPCSTLVMLQGTTVDAVTLPYPEHRFAVFLLFQLNPGMLLQTVRSFLRAGWGKRIVILNNSGGGLDLLDLGSEIGEVLDFPVPLTFSQMQEYIRTTAIERSYEWYFWGHSDVLTISEEDSRSFSARAIECVLKVQKKDPNWGVIFYAYDLFAAYNTDKLRDIPWDTAIAHYTSDCDFYHRIRLAGKVTRSCNAGRVFHVSQVFESIPESGKAAIEYLEREAPLVKGKNRTAWRDGEDVASIQQREQRETQAVQGREYYRRKWGVKDCDLTEAGVGEPWNHTAVS